VRISKSVAAGVLLAFLLSSGGSAAVTHSKQQRRHRSGTVAPETAPAGTIFVANPAGDALSVFPGGSSGNAPSLVTNPGLASPSAIARDGAGNMYVANPVSSSITVYGAGASGNSSPTAAITGASTGLNYPVGIALDSSGNIYVADAGSSDGGTDNIFVYPPAVMEM